MVLNNSKRIEYYNDTKLVQDVLGDIMQKEEILQKVLIVDDDEASAFIFRRNFKSMNIECDCASNAEEAIDYLENNEMPAMILLDVVLPDMSGLEVLVKIRKLYDKVELPVVMITHVSNEANIVDALDSEANDYITKPININIAQARINSLLTMSKLHRESIERSKHDILNSMVTTYNHEINNPLSVLMGNLQDKPSDITDHNLAMLKKSAARIRAIIRKIREVTCNELQTEDYSDTSKILKI